MSHGPGPSPRAPRDGRRSVVTCVRGACGMSSGGAGMDTRRGSRLSRPTRSSRFPRSRMRRASHDSGQRHTPGGRPPRSSWSDPARPKPPTGIERLTQKQQSRMASTRDEMASRPGQRSILDQFLNV
jgi:hypothetical protein